MSIFMTKKRKAKYEAECKAIKKASFICNVFMERKEIEGSELKSHLKELKDMLQNLGKESMLKVSEESSREDICENMKMIAFCLM